MARERRMSLTHLYCCYTKRYYHRDRLYAPPFSESIYTPIITEVHIIILPALPLLDSDVYCCWHSKMWEDQECVWLGDKAAVKFN